MKLFKLIAILLFSVLLFQCTETKEGCLDINSPNFDVDADEPCDDCCENSQLELSFIHRYWDKNSNPQTVRLGTKFNVFPDTNHFIQINQLHFYLTDFQMIKTNGSILESTSSTIIESDPPITIKDNNAYLNRNNVNAQSMGDFTPSDGIESLRFKIGIDGIYNQIIPDSLGVNHPFGWKSDSVNWKEGTGYNFMRIEFLTYTNDSTLIDSIPRAIEITNPDAQLIEIPAIFDLQTGLNTTVTLLMNYNSLFEGTDIVNDTLPTIKTQIVQNISNSIVLDTITQKVF